MYDHHDRRVLITAGASGIGNAIAGLFAQEGAKIHIVDIDQNAINRLIEANPAVDDWVISQADVSDEQTVAEIFSTQSKKFDGIDILVNCAGIKGPTGPVEDLKLLEWRQCLAVNLESAFLCARSAVPMFKHQGSGNIINISSTAGWHGYPLRSPYAAAKWAVIGLTKSLAMELGPFGIRANAICPGSVNGDRMDRVIKDEAKEKNLTEDQVRTAYTNSVSLRSFIDAEDIAQTALFLGSRAASRITGQAISVDGHLENFGGLDQQATEIPNYHSHIEF